METSIIDGVLFEKMLKNGLANLSLHENELNDMNVFPVADGDTGTNMCATLESGINSADTTADLGAYLEALTTAMLFGARGNSGVILSQIFTGLHSALSGNSDMDCLKMKDALISGYKTAYKATVNPVEGTILTVVREGIENINNKINNTTTFERMLSMYIAEMRKSLSNTPKLLPKLKEAGVIDSGAMGYIVIAEGMLKYLYGENVDYMKTNKDFSEYVNTSIYDLTLFNEGTIFDSGYCMEFILQLMNGERYSDRFYIKRYIEDLQDFGNSIVAVQDRKRVKVHIHTFKPGKVFMLSQEYGEFITCKIENMQLQHNMVLKQKSGNPKRIPFGVVAVTDSLIMRDVFKDLACNDVIMGDTKMNISVGDFVESFKSVNADTIVVLPNNSNLIRTAKQAGELFADSKIIVLETNTIPQGYCAMQMDIADSTDYSYRVRLMKTGMNDVVTLSVATSSKEYHTDAMNISGGKPVAVTADRVLCSAEDEVTAFVEGLSMLMQEDEKEVCVVFRGESQTEAAQIELENIISSRFPLMDVSFINGGSGLYHWTAALM